MKTDLEKLCEKLKIECATTRSATPPPKGFPVGSNSYLATLRYGKRKMSVPFFTGPLLLNTPSAADVLYCLCIDTRAGEQSFEEFCSDFGYDSDSLLARRAWRECVKLAPSVRRFLGSDFDAVAAVTW